LDSETSLQIRCSSPSNLTSVPEYLRTTTTLKALKSGGLIRIEKTATIAEGTGLRCYGGTSLETPIGTAEKSGRPATLLGRPQPDGGVRALRPLLLADYVVEAPLQFRDFRVWVPKGPGLGAALDEEKMDHYGRASS
jgi:muconate cycloisomerase